LPPKFAHRTSHRGLTAQRIPRVGPPPADLDALTLSRQSA